MVTTVTIAGVDVDYQSFEVDIPLSPMGLAPEATIELPTRQNSVTPGDPVTITIDGDTVFDGEATTSGRIREDGRREVPCEHDGVNLFEETVTFTSTFGTDEAVLQDALNATDRGSSFTLNFGPSTTGLANDYECEDRPLKRVFRDMMDRGDNVWWVNPATNTITVETLGARGQFKALNAQTDAVAVRQFDPGSVDSVRNVVTVVGTGFVEVRQTITDSDSISEYGRQPAEKPYNYNYVTDPLEATELANKLIIPDPLASGRIDVTPKVGDVTQPLPNYTVALDDAAKGISETGLVIERQTIKSDGSVTCMIGEGAGVNFDEFNRKGKSGDDNSRPGSVYDSDRIADGAVEEAKLVDLSVTEQKLADLAVATAKLRDNAVINGKLSDLSVSETKIQDGSISTPKIRTEAVTAGEIETDTITAAQIDARTITALEIESDTLTANEIDARTITALEIDTGTLTANEIDTLDLDTEQLSVTDSTTGATLEFFGDVNGGIAIEPTGNISLASPFSDPFQLAVIQQVVPDGDDVGLIGDPSSAYSEIWAYEYFDAGTGSAINDGGDPLAGLADGHGPPDHCERCDDETGETLGYSLSDMARSAWDVIRAQQREIESQQERIDSLEERLSELERQNT